MKLEVEPNMYVRTKTGIKQIYTIDNNKTKYKYLYKLKKQDGDGCIDCGALSSEDILKASHNIIDLIEPGDYVNGYYVEDVKETYVNIATGSNYFQKPSIFEEDIKSIVTKEQFEAMQYKVVEE